MSQEENEPALPMTREAVLERMSVSVRDHPTNHCGLSDPSSGGTIFCDDQRLDGESDGYGKPLRCAVCHCKAQSAAALDASGLLPHLESLQAELRHLGGRPAVPGKPLELRSRDELLAAVHERDLLIESQQSQIRELDGRLAEMEAELGRKDEALKRGVFDLNALADQWKVSGHMDTLGFATSFRRARERLEAALSPAPSSPPSHPTNSPTDQPQE